MPKIEKKSGGYEIRYWLITSGIDIDPDHGTQSAANYNKIKKVMSLRSEVSFFYPVIKQIENTDPSPYLHRYSIGTQRVWQLLIGVDQHSNSWNTRSLTHALTYAKWSAFETPINNQYSVDWYISQTNGFSINYNQGAGWINYNYSFFQTGLTPGVSDGLDGETWWVTRNDGTTDFYFKNKATWGYLSNYIAANGGKFYISSVAPPNTPNSFWLDTSGLSVRQYNSTTQLWNPPSNITFLNTPPLNPLNGDLWINTSGPNTWPTLQYYALLNQWLPISWSLWQVYDNATKSQFLGLPIPNTFYIDDEPNALFGGILVSTLGAANVRVMNQGTLIGTFTDLNFTGAGVIATPDGINPNQADITIPGGGTITIFQIATTATSNNQTNFTVVGASEIINLFVNGEEQPEFTYASPTLTFDPIAAGFELQIGDEVVIQYLM
jgi:hypothetical protein